MANHIPIKIAVYTLDDPTAVDTELIRRALGPKFDAEVVDIDWATEAEWEGLTYGYPPGRHSRSAINGSYVVRMDPRRKRFFRERPNGTRKEVIA